MPYDGILGNGQLTIKVYEPNYLTYETHALSDGLVVFSEIYYSKGWKAYVDDLPTESLRVNYILRALAVPAGKHIIRWQFSPDSYNLGNQVMLVSSCILGVLVMLSVGYWLYRLLLTR